MHRDIVAESEKGTWEFAGETLSSAGGKNFRDLVIGPGKGLSSELLRSSLAQN